MSRRVLFIIGGVVAVAVVAFGLWFQFAPENYETSDVNDQVERLSLDDASSADDSVDADTEESMVDAADDSADAEAAEAEAVSDPIVFSIDPDQSTAEFNIDEDLRGERVTVVGTTNQVAGDISIDSANPANSEIGQILINARDLQTDDSGRNRALRNFILQSAEDQYEFIRFDPNTISGMPASVAVGDTIEFQITGDLTIKDATQEATFDVTVTPNSETEIEGTAQTTVAYADYGLTIPDVPFVANVADDVTLIFNFVAVDAETTTASNTRGIALMMGTTRRDIAQDEPAATEDPMMEATEEMMATAEATEEAMVDAGPVMTEDGLLVTAVVFCIDSERSVAEFNIDEDLRGERVTVVGTTDQVAGDFLVDLVDTDNTQVGQILINARDLQTDASGRNRALRNFILESSNDDFEFITFDPTSLDGLPEAVAVGQEFTFQVTGDLTIKDVTREVVFDVTISPDSVEEISGTAETVVLWQDFDLTIPDVPFVANIADEVVLRFNFTAAAVEIGTEEPDMMATEEAMMEATEEMMATEEAE